MPELPKTLLPHWRIDGTLTTLGPLRVGDGGEMEGRIRRDDEPLAVQTVFAGARQRAYIPGSSLKGFLRSLLTPRLATDHLRAIFGYQSETSHLTPRGEGLGGALTVWDAPAVSGHLPTDVPEPDWSPERATCVAPHVAIQRRTGTAAENLLYYEEYVPAEVSFDVVLLIEGGELLGLDGEEIAGTLLAALNGLESSGAPLGACRAQGWGRLRWEAAEQRLSRLTEGAIKRWLEKPDRPLADAMDAADAGAALARDRALPGASTSGRVEFEIDLHFPGPFLVNDGSLTKGKHERSSDKPNHAAMRTYGGKPLLPASSLHGALRSQAERIARTLAGPEAADWVHDPSGASGKKPANVVALEDLSKMDAVSCLFGAPGWRSPIELRPFQVAPDIANPALARQEFVAIDRFTGGGADTLKFNAEGFAGTTPAGFTLRGRLSLNLRALATLTEARGNAPPVFPGSPPSWGDLIYLLAFALRDLCEGDVGLGFGRAKGYGACTASVRATAWDNVPGLDDHMAQLLASLFPPRPIEGSVSQ